MSRALAIAIVVSTLAAAHAAPKAASKPPKTPPAATTCTEPSQCGLYPADCCGDCGAFTPDHVVAYNIDWIGEHAQPGCVDMSCPKCARDEEEFPQRQYQLVATCEKRTCVVKKLDHMPITQCTRDDQCVVATPRCCACDWSNAVAVRKDKQDELRKLACTTSSQGVGCPACAKTGGLPHVECKKGRCALKLLNTNAPGLGITP